MKAAIMQPYFLPYIGYFQMIRAVDAFVFYDDVHFINRGWINRNRILVNNEARYITIPLIKASQNKRIDEIEVSDDKEYQKVLKTIQLSYKKAPYFSQIYPLLEELLTSKHASIATLAMDSCRMVCNYLGVKTQFYVSSLDFASTQLKERAERLQAICKQLNADHYINAMGGVELYSKSNFLENGITLNFIQPKPIVYRQFNDDFVPWLSMLDVLMFNDPDSINNMLTQYELV